MLVLSLIILFMGLAATAIFTGIDQDKALFALMETVLPPWLIGVGFATMLAVVMSSVDSLLIGGSTIIYRAVFADKNVRIARLITVAFGAFGFILAFLVPEIVTLSLLTAYFALLFVPSIFAGIYAKNISPEASFHSLLVPSIVLLTTFPLLQANAFIIPLLLSVGIILSYDNIFQGKKA